MMKRALIVASIALALLPGIASADIEGTNLQHRDNWRCAAMGQAFERHGLTENERRHLDRWHCVKRGDDWQSDRFYTA